MIRFIDLRDQITCDGTKQFAWFDTIHEEFLKFSDVQVWDNWKDFVIDFKDDDDYKINQLTSRNLKRFEILFQWKDQLDTG